MGAVLGISAVSATFSRIFSGFWAGFWVLFWGFLQFQLLFHRFFPDFGLGFGCCFRDFCSFSYFFPGLFQLLGWILGAVLGISAVSATFSRIFPDFELGFGLVLEYNHKKAKHAIKIWHSLINQIHQIMHQIDAHMNCYPKNNISSFYINQTKRNSG